MTHHNRSADRETYAHALGLGREKSGKDVFKMIRCNPGSTVAQNEDHVPPRIGGRGDSDFALSLITTLNGLHRVDENVHNNLLQLNAIAKHRGNSAAVVSLNTNSTGLNLMANEKQAFFDNVIHHKLNGFWNLLNRHATDTLYYIVSTSRARGNSCGKLRYLAEIGLVAFKPAQ